MAKKFRDLVERTMTPEARGRAATQTRRMLSELPLQKLRRARGLAQETLAEAMGVAQSEVSRIERRSDVYLSTLAKYVEAMGGSIEIRASFPDGTVTIASLREIADSTARARSARRLPGKRAGAAS